MMKRQSITAAEENDERVIASLTAKFVEFENTDLLGSIIETLRENIKPGICLICIEDVERKEAIWTCQSCFCILHLVCIQRWAKDSISNVKQVAAERGFNIPIIWCCPKCRGEYNEESFPSVYKCYCGKETNPTDDLWNAPHSCGAICSKQLKNCEHVCTLLCHSGQCPQCPKQVNKTCFCGQSNPRTLRCYAKDWSCDNICSKDLSCGFHKCSEKCHSTDCPKCEIPVTLNCKCSAPRSITVGCADLAAKTVPITCGETCSKRLSCGIHNCKRKCHEGSCGSCSVSCPCGKQQVECNGSNSSSGWEKSCGETCLKLLECNEHRCQQKCHGGSCGECLELKKRRCRCGAYENEIQCSKEFVCTTRCGKLKNCGLHSCNKKCCPGDCTYSCSKTCDKTLKCKNHKCVGTCGHRGPCFPCPVSAPVKCRCGETVIYVPCGSERRAKPPSCSKLCALKTKCDHPQIQAHSCHFGDCPKCTLRCGKKLDCGHDCVTKCHTLKTKRKVCSPCMELVPSKCPLHLETLVPCSQQNNSCQDLCGKTLGCGFHKCFKKCHLRIQDHCGDCEEPCGRERSCDHQCDLGCHTGPCADCSLMAKIPCHCGAETIFAMCFKRDNLSEMEKSCKNQCSGKLTCSHRCLQICHSGACPETERCRRKVKLSCKCRKLKKDVDCYLVDREKKTLECLDPPCSISSTIKSVPTESPNGSQAPRKRNRKKKASESETGTIDDAGETVEEIKEPSFARWKQVMYTIGAIAVGVSFISFIFQSN